MWYNGSMKSANGFTLIEIIIAVSVLGLILIMIILGFSNFLATQKLGQINEDVISFIKKAREKTMASEGGFSYGVHITEDRLVIFRAPTYIEGDQNNETYAFPSDFFVSSIALQGGGSNVIFQRLTGATASYGTIIIKKRNDASLQKTIRIYEAGIVELQ